MGTLIEDVFFVHDTPGRIESKSSIASRYSMVPGVNPGVIIIEVVAFLCFFLNEKTREDVPF